MSKFAIVPGSFDPITAGHFEIIRRAAAIFDHVTVAILVNSEKAGTFSPDERLEAANAAIRELEKDGITNVDARVFRGLTVDAARDAGAGYIVKGLRNTSDFDYEFGMAEITRRFDENIETVFLPSSLFQKKGLTIVLTSVKLESDNVKIKKAALKEDRR